MPSSSLQPTVEELLTRLERIEERLRRLDDSERAEESPGGHMLFVPTAAGYAIVEREGMPPQPGDEVLVDGNAYRAQRSRSSPFPADPRCCVIVEAAEPT
jgi:hypothetical protein